MGSDLISAVSVERLSFKIAISYIISGFTLGKIPIYAVSMINVSYRIVTSEIVWEHTRGRNLISVVSVKW